MALDGALHDWLGKRCGLPVWRLLGVEGRTPPTSYTIGIDTVEGTADRTRRAVGYEVLKVKVGGADDLARLHAVRDNTDARIRIDGNEGWTLETARELMPELVAMGIEFVEQPFPAEDLDAYRALRELPAAAAGDHRRGLQGPLVRSPRSPPTPTASTSSSPRPAACARGCAWCTPRARSTSASCSAA